MKVAIVGLGKWGQVLKKELETLAEIKYECDSKSDLNAVYADPEVEAIFVATPTDTHFEIAKSVLDAGKHLFLEKPGTNSIEKLEELVNIAESKNLKFAVGYEFPHHPVAGEIKKLIKDRKVLGVYFQWQKWGTFKDDATHHLLCHDVSLMKYFGFSELAPINHQRTKVISDTDVISTQFQNKEGVYIKSIINRISPTKQKTVTILYGDGGYIWNNDELFEIDLPTQELVKIEVSGPTAVGAELADFLSAIKESRSPLCNGKFALEIFKVIDSVRSSQS